MTMRAHNDVVNGACNNAVDRVDNGANPNGTMEFYSGSPPATLAGAPAGDLLAVVDFAATAFGASGASTVGVASAASVPLATTGADDGTVGFARVLDGDDVVLWDDDDVGTSGNAITLNVLTIATGVDFEVVSYDFSVVTQS